MIDNEVAQIQKRKGKTNQNMRRKKKGKRKTTTTRIAWKNTRCNPRGGVGPSKKKR